MTLDEFRAAQTRAVIITWCVVGAIVLAGVTYAIYTAVQP